MPPSQQAPFSIVLRIDFAPEERLGRGKIRLLELIRETGSISAAGRAMDMSYRRAWMLVDQLNRMFQEPAVESQRGGKQGGGAQLTAFGEDLICRYRAMEQQAMAAIESDLDWLRRHRRDETTAGLNEEPVPRS